MATLVGILDGTGMGGNTDNNVLVMPDKKHMLWIPRDLMVPSTQRRINCAFKTSGCKGYLKEASELGFSANRCLVLANAATRQVLKDAAVTVPVTLQMSFRYPANPLSTLEEGEKVISFNPPRESLYGERIHQWLGARYGYNYSQTYPDIHRCRRQTVFVRELLRTPCNFAACLANPEWVASHPSLEAATEELRGVTKEWTFSVFENIRSLTNQFGEKVLAVR